MLTNVAVFPGVLNIELRKFVDTRAALWTIVSLWGAALLVIATYVFGLKTGVTWAQATGAMAPFVAFSSALIGILGMTGDWTAKVTANYFPTIRSRGVIFLAKTVASLLVAVAFIVGMDALGGIVAAASNLIWSGRFEVGSTFARQQAFVLSSSLLGTTLGVGLASIIRRPIVSIVAVLVAIVGWNFLVFTRLPSGIQNMVSPLTPLAWYDRVTAGLTIVDLLVSFALWYVAPLILGWLIWRRAEA